MAVSRRPERLRLTPRSVVLAVAMFGATLALLRVAAASHRVLGWVAAAAVIAALIHPIVETLSRWMPRALAVALVVLLVLGAAATVGYAVVHSVARQTDRLKASAPAAARKLERSERYGELAREFKLVERTKRFVD